ncbi:MAG: hypothetical protein Q4P15_10645 [Propionibacteriaceae bacterium]|nr:hypothetical protein [Propionibacteriaceae bacterium]
MRNTERELVALVLAGEDEVGVIRSSLEERAEVDWRELSSGEAYEGVLSAFEEAPELIVVVGPGLLPEVDIISASYLDQEVVLLGGQIAEPTENVTAILWPGADDRAALAGSELSFEGGDRWGERAVQVALDPASSGREVITLTDSGLG